MKFLCATILLSTFLGSAVTSKDKADPYAGIDAGVRTVLAPAIERYAKDQIKQNWSDLWEIDEQDVATKRDFFLSDNAQQVDKAKYVELKKMAIANGGTPVLTGFELRSVVKQDNAYLISACAPAKRESFHFKGIIEFTAHVQPNKVTFDSWSYKYSMPHSCEQKVDSE